MGTYRNYKFSVYRNDNNIPIQEIFDAICKMMVEQNRGFWGIQENIQEIIDENNGKVTSEDLILVSYTSKKWIDRDKEMSILSKMFPSVIFKTFAVNDCDKKDAWNVYYKDGISYCPKKYGKAFKEATLDMKRRRIENS